MLNRVMLRPIYFLTPGPVICLFSLHHDTRLIPDVTVAHTFAFAIQVFLKIVAGPCVWQIAMVAVPIVCISRGNFCPDIQGIGHE